MRSKLAPLLGALLALTLLGAPAVAAGPGAAGTPVKSGTYDGSFYTSQGKQLEGFTFKVTPNRKLTKLSALLDVTCSYFPPTVETQPFGFPSIKIDKRGRFDKTWKPNDDTEIRVEGRIKGGRLVSGSLDYTVGICVRTAILKAARR